jgi:hypothetical protein
MLDLVALRREAGTVSREQFAERYPRLYLVVLQGRDEEVPIGFRTLVGRRDELEATDGADPLALDGDGGSGGIAAVLALEKALGNPYPNQLSVGRARNCDVVVRHASVSKLHAHFLLPTAELGSRALQLVDRGSGNGTSVNGSRLVAETPRTVAPGDVIRFGGVRCTLLPGDRLYDLLLFE